MAKTAEQLAKARNKRDVKEIALLILDAPMKNKEELLEINDLTTMEDLLKKGVNTDVKTRILSRMAAEAMNGNLKAAETFFKYAGLEPVREANVTVSLPTIVDDMADLDDDLNVTVRRKKKKVKPEEPPTYVKE